MKIITAGRLPEDREHEAVCTKCKTHFSFRQSEAGHYDDRNESGLTVICPLPGCGHKNYVRPNR